MNEEKTSSDRAFDLVEQDSRIARTARMLEETARLQPNQRADIIQRCLRFIEDTDYTQAAIARELGISTSTIAVVRVNGDAVPTGAAAAIWNIICRVAIDWKTVPAIPTTTPAMTIQISTTVNCRSPRRRPRPARRFRQIKVPIRLPAIERETTTITANPAEMGPVRDVVARSKKHAIGSRTRMRAVLRGALDPAIPRGWGSEAVAAK